MYLYLYVDTYSQIIIRPLIWFVFHPVLFWMCVSKLNLKQSRCLNARSAVTFCKIALLFSLSNANTQIHSQISLSTFSFSFSFVYISCLLRNYKSEHLFLRCNVLALFPGLHETDACTRRGHTYCTVHTSNMDYLWEWQKAWDCKSVCMRAVCMYVWINVSMFGCMHVGVWLFGSYRDDLGFSKLWNIQPRNLTGSLIAVLQGKGGQHHHTTFKHMHK